jgi:hypothetical protein
MPDSQELDASLVEDIERELQKCNVALHRLGTLLSTEGIDPSLLMMFRDSVSRVRIAAWAAQKSIADREGMSFERLLAAERVRSIASMCEELSEFVGCNEPSQCPVFDKLLQEMTKLTTMIRLKGAEPA